MNERPEFTDTEIRKIATSFPYPVTPDLAAGVQLKLENGNGRRRTSMTRLAWAAIFIFILLASMMVVPQVRAAVFRIFNIGAITIFELDNTEQPLLGSTDFYAVKPSMTPLVPPEIALEVSLQEAQDLLKTTPLYLPAYPSSLTKPDRLYWVDPQYQLTPTVISIWEEEGLALYQIGVAQFASKGASHVTSTAVNDQPAFWLDQPHPFRLQTAEAKPWRYVEGNLLIWWHEDGFTFRLEGAASLEEAVQLAESLEKMED